jgi:hypothetical protein
MGVELARNFVQRQEGFAQEEKSLWSSSGAFQFSTLRSTTNPGTMLPVRGSSLLFFAMGVALQRMARRRCFGIPQSLADPPLLSKTFNAIAKKYDAKAKKGETTGMEICRIIHEHYPWNHREARPRQTQSWHH